MYYGWKKRLLSSAARVFDHKGDNPSVREERQAAELAPRRGGWPARRKLGVLGVSRSSYYRWKRDQAWLPAG